MPRIVPLLLLVILAAIPASVSGQEARYRAPRTEDGRPDLQGVWNFSSGVPLQRPAAFADKKTVTKEEFEQQRARARNALDMIAKFVPVEAIGLDWLDNAPVPDDFRTSLITYPENGRLPALVKGVRRIPNFDDIIAVLSDPKASPQSLLSLAAAFGGGRKDSYTDFMMSERCLFTLDVPLVAQFDGSYVQIVQSPSHVVLMTELGRRLITLDGSPSTGDQLRSWSGTSRGRWEGETLIVETRSFNDKMPSFAGAGTARDKVVTERFTRTANDRIEYTATVIDPTTFMDRIELAFPMVPADARIFEMACHEGNYSMRNSLAAARKEDAEGVRPDPTRPRQQVTVFDRSGAVVARLGEPGTYTQPAFSPDASQIAVIKTDDKTGNRDVWTFDVASGTGRPLSSDAALDSAPLWSPDGKSIVYASVRKNNIAVLVRRAADGTGSEEQIYEHDTTGLILTDWSRDGRFLTFWSNQGMFILPLTGDKKPIAMEDGRGGRFSPDGRWFAYSAADAKQLGRFHVFVRPFDAATIATATPAPVQVSQANAIGAIAWRNDGRELYFLQQPPPAQTVMAVDIQASGGASTPRALFQLPPGVGAPAQLSNVASPDGQRFVFTVNLPPASAAIK